jgi:hypothetical protein
MNFKNDQETLKNRIFFNILQPEFPAQQSLQTLAANPQKRQGA